ncbi:MAG: PQQ-binding-like beta-propeller repeat protein, partial [Pirellulales bacterium]|nr:PQQ-binding-like beta-propeller repeat protein [Pirellulales bacterium]
MRNKLHNFKRDEGSWFLDWLFVLSAVLCIFSAPIRADDWPTYQHDSQRSGVTSEAIPPPLNQVWHFQPVHPPMPAWPEPAEHDYWHEHHNLRATVDFDSVFHGVVAGDTLFFGSSADDQIYALNAATGELRWSFFTEGPIRFAPTVAGGRVYVGSDDGMVYCLSATDGALFWKYRAFPEDRRLPGNGRMISLWPIRTGIVVDGQKVYFGAGLFPNEKVYLFALDANDGSLVWKTTSDVSLQGYMLASGSRLYMPTGRTAPALFARDDGAYLGQLEGAGGAYALLTDDVLTSGPGRGEKQISLADSGSRDVVASFNGLRLVVKDPIAYMQSETQLTAFNRKENLILQKQRNQLDQRREELTDLIKKHGRKNIQAVAWIAELEKIQIARAKNAKQLEECNLWRIDCQDSLSMILANDLLFIGGDQKVAARRVSDGVEIWSAPVHGKACGLSAASGRLFVSTDSGSIHCFSPSAGSENHLQREPDPEPYPRDSFSDLYASAARKIVDQTHIHKGYCLVLGSREGRLAYELAKRTDLQIIGLEPDADQVAKARKALDAAGLYGSRVTIHHGPLERLPYPAYFANLIVSDQTLVTGELPPSPSEVFRVLRPCGGIVYLGQPPLEGTLANRLQLAELETWIRNPILPGNARIVEENGLWAILSRGPVPGSGEWTQLYCDAGHTSCSQESLRGPMTVQWFGRPGSRQIIDRHHRPMSPLYRDGRLFIPANNRIITMDAYNGTPLWELEVPNSRRIGVLKDSGHMLCTEDDLYIAAQDHCLVVKAASGRTERVLNAPQLISWQKHDWGYLNYACERIIGSGQKAGASFQDLAWRASPNSPNKLLEGDYRAVIASDYLFCLDRQTGAECWKYRNGVILNSAITVGDGRIYFAESRNPAIQDDADGRIRIDEFCELDTFLVALDLDTGNKVWERPCQFPFEHILFLNTNQNTLLVTGTYNKNQLVHYGLYAFHADTGSEKWDTEYVGLNVAGTEPFGVGGEHGEQWQHPVINGSTIFSRPYAFNLFTGAKKSYHVYRGGHGCGGLTGSAYYL